MGSAANLAVQPNGAALDISRGKARRNCAAIEWCPSDCRAAWLRCGIDDLARGEDVRQRRAIDRPRSKRAEPAGRRRRRRIRCQPGANISSPPRRGDRQVPRRYNENSNRAMPRDGNPLRDDRSVGDSARDDRAQSKTRPATVGRRPGRPFLIDAAQDSLTGFRPRECCPCRRSAATDRPNTGTGRAGRRSRCVHRTRSSRPRLGAGTYHDDS